MGRYVEESAVMEASESRFTGWHRPSRGHPWRKLVESESEAECWELLNARVETGDMKVLLTGQHPLDIGSRGELRIETDW